MAGRGLHLLGWPPPRVPIVLATFPIIANVYGSLHLLHIVFVLVVVFTLVQGPTLPAAARLLRIAQPGAVRESRSRSPLWTSSSPIC